MTETFTELARLRQTERRVAMATLVATRGTTPKKEGAKMWVGEGGRILGSITIGGCVDARVVAESERVLASSRPGLLSMSLGDEDAWDLGLTCAGTVNILIEPVELDRDTGPSLAMYERIQREIESGRQAVAVTRLSEPWSKMLVLQDGGVTGTLGGGALDHEGVERARDLMRGGGGGGGREEGGSCTLTLCAGGDPVDAFFEVHGPPATLIVFGAGHVAMSLITIARTLGMRTIVIDARERFATRERFPDADEIRVGIPSEIAESLKYGSSTYVVLVAHDYKYEIPVLKHVLAGDAAYVGMLGSRRRGRAILDFLAEEGVSREALERIHVPIGLDIGARSVPEIALSILAEAVAARAGRAGTSLRGQAVV